MSYDLNANYISSLQSKVETYLNNFIDNFEFNDQSARILYNVILWHLHVLKGYSIESVQRFTTYNFINVQESFVLSVGYPLLKFQVSFIHDNWTLSAFEMKLLTTYLTKVRDKWASKHIDSLTCFREFGKFTYITSSFFVNELGNREIYSDPRIPLDDILANVVSFFYIN